ncbi:family 43 glycosylhydrolase [Foetidibacter luteolus]|uniref:family 43 glycosylhydrolase n=1 Tax=Foetidibacter luteolus TaxID=2608880 RepID=UPI00129A2212|nr:family 43 glycosylhydrolase [Foetidibacter luteolus]
MQIYKVMIAFVLAACVAPVFAQVTIAGKHSQTTICNPLNLSYRFCLDSPSRREAADPTIVNFKNEYYLFASKSGGYWHSTDLANWQLISTADLPLEDYAPAAFVMRDTLFFMASAGKPVIYKTADPQSGKWQVACPAFAIGMIDPAFLVDDDGRLYFYYGCSNINPIYGVELDTVTFAPLGKPVALMNSNKKQYGWERKGDYNDGTDNPWIEGAWVNKQNGKYYLQYAGPGTEYKSYADAVYVSYSPLGPYQLAPNNPFSSKPEGFIAGAGHGSTFKDIYGNYWHIGTMTISQKHMFERRLGLFPTFFDGDGALYTYTGFGDFPMRMPRQKIKSPGDLFPGWMLLSYKKQVQVSSESPGHEKSLLNDEDVRTFWSAQTGNKGEWARLDLGADCSINAVQLNFAEHLAQARGRNDSLYFAYLLEYSTDDKNWHTLADKTNSRDDLSHDYIELEKAVKARYLRLVNHHTPSGNFALAGFRVFGKGGGKVPAEVTGLAVNRLSNDAAIVNLQWQKAPGATGYNIRYGTAPGKMYHVYQVLDTAALTIRSLNQSETYYFSIDAFNDAGVTTSKKVIVAHPVQ